MFWSSYAHHLPNPLLRHIRTYVHIDSLHIWPQEREAGQDEGVGGRTSSSSVDLLKAFVQQSKNLNDGGSLRDAMDSLGEEMHVCGQVTTSKEAGLWPPKMRWKRGSATQSLAAITGLLFEPLFHNSALLCTYHLRAPEPKASPAEAVREEP